MTYWDYYWRFHRIFCDSYKKTIGVPLPKFVSDRQCLFIHIPKTAGMSLIKSLYGREIGHTRLSFYREIPDDIYVFSVVRNPFDRAFSAWNFLYQGGMIHHPNGIKFKQVVLDRFVDFNDFVCNWLACGNERAFIHFVPQFEFLISKKGSFSRVDKLIKFESLADDFEHLRQRVLGTSELKMVNVSGHKDYRKHYNKESIEHIVRIYKRDFELLGYEDLF